MVFSSFEFLFRFLPFFLLIYYVTPKKWKNAVLFAGSILFYTTGEAEYVVLLLASVVINYILGRFMYRDTYEGRGKKQLILLIMALCYDFGVLFLFKYSGLMDKLPLGISFYTFQIAAYIIDVYRGKVPVEKSFIRLGTYLMMFPQLIAGPIINYSEVRMALCSRTVTIEQFESGLKTLILGLGAKVIVADRIGLLWNNIQSIGFESISTPLAWMGAFAYSLELYFDFSGYSLMAIGLGRIFGFNFPENFNYPYISKSITEFWRRWHISLSTWFKDYVYIPLGGNRDGKYKQIRNILIVWLLTGIWHGANWTFLIWGLLFGILLIIEKIFLNKFMEKLPSFIRRIYVLFIVMILFVIFNSDNMSNALINIKGLFGMNGEVFINDYTLHYLKSYLPILIIAIFGATPFIKTLIDKLRKNKYLNNIINILEPILIVIILFVVTSYLIDNSYNPFLYFRF